MKNGLIIDDCGNKFWWKDDQLHNENGPAFESFNGYKAWYINGRLRRLDGGPVLEPPNGDKIIMKNGLIIGDCGSKFWWKDDQLHNENGPAYESLDGHKEWYINGYCRRLDGGPVVERSNGDKYWFYKGECIKCSSQEAFETYIKRLVLL